MIKFIPILSDVINEQKRHKFDSETYAKIHSVVDKLWKDRNIEYKNKTNQSFLKGINFFEPDWSDLK
jgi:hypothetical protein